MSEKDINHIEIIEINSSDNLEVPVSIDKKIQKVADFVTKAVLETPKPMVFKGKDGSEAKIENRGGLWRL